MRCFAALLLFGLLFQTARADDRQQILEGYIGSPRQVDSLKVADGWGLVSWSLNDGGGMDIHHKLDGRWIYIAGGGGAVGPRELFRYGVPRGTIPKLLTYRVSEAEMSEAVASFRAPEWAWLTAERRLTDEDLDGYGAWELMLMRNEIYASHGRRFQDPELNAYFKSRPWYRVNPDFHDGLLTPLERANASYISDYQRRNNLKL
jgi:hypothetical protein